MTKITILGSGTSTGVPVITCKCSACISTDIRDKRTRVSVLIETNNQTIVIDTGPDFRQQMLREDVQDLDAVLITHAHKDHIAGLDDIRPFNYLKNKHIDVYCEPSVEAALRREFPYIFEEKDPYPGVPKLSIQTIGEEKFFIGDACFIPIRAMHHKMPVLGFRMGDFTYITDANFIDDANLAKIKGSEILVINGIRWEAHYSHYNVAQAIEVIENVGVKRAFLTHISHNLGPHAEAEQKLPSHISIAYDGMVFEV